MPSQPSCLKLFVGDQFLREKKIEFFLSQILSKEDRALNFLRIDLEETSLQDLLGQARSFPMLGKSQVFLVRNFLELKKEEIVLLEQYFQNPAGWSYFFFDTDEIADAHPLAKLAARYGERIDSIQDEKRSSLDFIHRKLKSENREITKEAWQFLEEKTGGNLMILDACIEKLMLYVDEKKPIDLASAQKLTDELLFFDSFDLTDAICEKDTRKALQVFHFLYDLEGSATMVIGLLNWQLKRIWQAKMVLKEKGEREIPKTIRISPYHLPGFLRQVARFSFQELEDAFNKLFEIDWKLKTGQFNEKVVLESFIIKLASLKNQPALSC